jgi:mannose-6-phosphate isomerase-like protein (cupin superfamily)
MRRPRVLLAVAAIGVLGAAATAHVIAQSTSPPAVQRQALAQSTKVTGAKGRTLGLSRVVIPAGGTIALHHHEGTQVAFIQSGVLTYTVRDGAVTVMSGPADDAQKVRQIKAGQTGKITAGQWIVEQPSTIHQAANQGKAKIVIYLSTLLKTGAPPSTPNS